MIKIKIKSIWQGKIGIRDKYLTLAHEKKQGFMIFHENEVMKIDYDKIKEKIIARSEKPFYDKFKGQYHWLYYFNWKPEIKQNQLL